MCISMFIIIIIISRHITIVVIIIDVVVIITISITVIITIRPRRCRSRAPGGQGRPSAEEQLREDRKRPSISEKEDGRMKQIRSFARIELSIGYISNCQMGSDLRGDVRSGRSGTIVGTVVRVRGSRTSTYSYGV